MGSFMMQFTTVSSAVEHAAVSEWLNKAAATCNVMPFREVHDRLKRVITLIKPEPGVKWSTIARSNAAALVARDIVLDIRRTVDAAPDATQSCKNTFSAFDSFLGDQFFASAMNRCTRIHQQASKVPALLFVQYDFAYQGPDICETRQRTDWDAYQDVLRHRRYGAAPEPTADPWSGPPHWALIDAWAMNQQATSDVVPMALPVPEAEGPAAFAPDMVLAARTPDGPVIVPVDPDILLEGGVRFGCETIDYVSITVPPELQVACRHAVDEAVDAAAASLALQRAPDPLCEQVYQDYVRADPFAGELFGSTSRIQCYSQHGAFSPHGNGYWLDGTIPCEVRKGWLQESLALANSAPLSEKERYIARSDVEISLEEISGCR